MLFSGRACFSPSVDASLRSAWVKHGGALTHSKQDFARARFFFCAGPDDPWLNELLSRSLVVRHAHWISKSISENMLVPVARYILDDQFDPINIKEETPCLENCTTLKPSERPISPKPLAPNALKRSLDFESQDASFTKIERPFKRARIQPEPNLTLASPTLLDQSPAPSSLFSTHNSTTRNKFYPTLLHQSPAPSPLFSTHNSTTRNKFYPSPINSSPLHKTPNRASTTAGLIQPPTPVKFSLVFPRLDLTTIDSRNRRRHAPPSRISVNHLLRAPRADACAFVPGKSYDGKVFICTNTPKLT